ncbi:MAG TPA: choice-of-anchor J domain-containing protein, partial [Chloroflexia bacterium]|nr:choice-of-anchor J domain-containing protein [Chloroflexia bacterium]
GDYAMIGVDPTDDCTFWMTTEYMATTGQSPWVTRIGSFKFPNCGGTPPPTNTPGPTPTNTPVPPTPTNTPVVPTPTPVPGGCGERLTNGGFESGTAPWVQSSSGGYQLIDTTRPRTGSYSAYMGGYNSGTDTLYQQVTIPSNATSATFSYWRYVTTQESGSTPYDYLYVEVRSSTGALLGTLQTVSNATTPKNGWTQSSFNVLAYKGQTVRFQFRATTDSTLPTSFFVDDVSLNTCQ